jgi:hypothetical protein
MMPTSAEKRAKIIAEQLEREKLTNPRAGMPTNGKVRTNWSASHPVAPRRRWAGGGRGGSSVAPGIG